jgi:3-oxoadipate enol-lactonase
MFTIHLAAELRETNIKVNFVHSAYAGRNIGGREGMAAFVFLREIFGFAAVAHLVDADAEEYIRNSRNSKKERPQMSSDTELPIVLVHGTMGKSEDWSSVVEKLSSSRLVIRPNYIERVAGRNSTNALAIKDLADEVVAAVRTEGKQRFDLVGCSLGAAVATCIAAEYPQMVRSLVLVSGFSNGSDPRMNLQFQLWLRLASTDKVAFTKLVLVSGLSPRFLSAFDEPTINGIIETFIASTDWRPIEQTIRVDLSLNVQEYGARIKTPTLLITGKHDQIVPPAYSENLVPDAKAIEVGSGHLIFLEKPVELASAILSFCQSQAGNFSSNQ